MLLQMSPASVLLERQQRLAERMFDQTGFSSPRYELVDNETKFKLSVDVPGVKEEDIDIQLEDGFLTVKGQRMGATESSRFSSKFSQTFSLDPSVDVDKFTATLSNGVLTVSAPKDVKKLEESIRRIPITAGMSPTLESASMGEIHNESGVKIPESDAKKEELVEPTHSDGDESEEINFDVDK
jgi:HSP20 family protein